MSRSGAALTAGVTTLALVALACGLAWSAGASLAAHPGGVVTHHHAELTAALLAAALAAYFLGVFVLAKATLPLMAALGVAVAIQLAPLAAPLLTSTDAWTYWAYGRLAAVHGATPT